MKIFAQSSLIRISMSTKYVEIFARKSTIIVNLWHKQPQLEGLSYKLHHPVVRLSVFMELIRVPPPNLSIDVIAFVQQLALRYSIINSIVWKNKRLEQFQRACKTRMYIKHRKMGFHLWIDWLCINRSFGKLFELTGQLESRCYVWDWTSFSM